MLLTVPHSQAGQTAIVGDLFGSRKISDRQVFAHQLDTALRKVNAEFATHTYAPLKAVRGIDEISGLLNRAEYSFEICARVNEEIFPHKIRWGIGNGFIDVNENSTDAGKLDGPAFHNAAEAMARAREQDLVYAFQMPDIPNSIAMLLESSAQLYSEIVSSWTKASADVARTMRVAKTQAEAANQLLVSPQRVSQLVKRGSINELHQFEYSIAWFISEYA